MENNNDIDDLFKDLIESYEMNHSEKVWDSLDKQLDKKANDRNRVIIFRLKIALSMVAFLFSSFGIYYYFNDSKDKKAVLISEKQGDNTENILQQNTTIAKVNAKIVSSTHEIQKFENKLTLKERAENTTSSNSPLITSLSKVSKIKSKTIVNYTSTANSIAIDTTTKSISSVNSNQPLLLGSKKIITKMSMDTINHFALNDMKSVELLIDSSIVSENNKDTSTYNRDTITDIVTNSSLPIIFPSHEKLDSILKQQLKNRFSVITYFSPDFRKSYIEEDDNENKINSQQEEAPDFSFNTGLLLGYDFTKNWSVKVGGTYNFLAQTINPKTIYAKNGTGGLAHYQFNTNYGSAEIPNDLGVAPVVGDSLIINSKSTQVLHFIGIPLMAKYQITRNKFSYYVQVGGSINFRKGGKLIVETPTKTQTIRKIDGLNEYYFGGMVGLGVSYNPIKKLSILFEPTVNGAITPINKNASVATRPVSLGLALGISWHF